MANETSSADTNRINVSWTEVVKYLIAVSALVGFSWFIIFLMGKTTDATELEWTRALYLLSGVEAVAFAAAASYSVERLTDNGRKTPRRGHRGQKRKPLSRLNVRLSLRPEARHRHPRFAQKPWN